MFIKNCWYVAGWDNEVSADGFLARTVISVPLVLWRETNGKVVVFEDRCCHRGAPLSMGRREDNCIRCSYHGLKFDATGTCIEIPSQAKVPPKFKVRNFPVVERHRWIWVWMGDPALADESLISDTHYLDDPAWASTGGHIHYDVNYLLLCDNLLDFTHLPYLHPTTLGGSPDYAAVLPSVERLERGVRTTKWVFNTQPPEYSKIFGAYEGKLVDRWMIYDFIAPGILLMDSGMVPAGQGIEARDTGRRVNALEFRGRQAVTPETENSTHYFFAHPHNFLIDQPEVTRSIMQNIAIAFEEDRGIITAQAKNLALDPDFKMLPMAADLGLAQFRRVVQHLLELESLDNLPIIAN
jgi:vanillate O-demethylase monooxygenase subunit